MQTSTTILEAATLQPRGLTFFERRKEAKRIRKERLRADKLALRMKAREERILSKSAGKTRRIKVYMDKKASAEEIRINMNPADEIISRNQMTESDLINAESALGATIFGVIPEGHQREFFRFNHNVWVFHENWLEGGYRRETTIRYEVREDGVYKLPMGGSYVKLEGVELRNFIGAAREYLRLVKSYLY